MKDNNTEDGKALLGTNLYKENLSVFNRYLSQTTQKEVLVKRVVQKIVGDFDLENRDKFTFLDIGCSDGLVTKAIADKLAEHTSVDIIGIDNSAESKKYFEKRFRGSARFMQEDTEQVESLPSADFILISHLLWFIDDIGTFLDTITQALNTDGEALIILNNKASDEARINNSPGSKNLSLSSKVQGILKEKEIEFKVEQINSLTDVSGLKDMNENGKALISFLKHNNFADIPEEDVQELRAKMLKVAGSDNRLTKREDYIWIYR